MRKVWDLMGGIHPPENKHQSTGEPIADLPLPPIFVLPLNQHLGTPAHPVIAVGDHVLKGQIIADARGVFSAALHAPTSGIIKAIEARPIAHPSGMSAPCIVLEPDGEDRWIELEPITDHRHVERTELVTRIRWAGIAGLGGAGFPTADKLSPRADHIIKTLILNGTECEPYITADDMLMRTYPQEVVEGALLLAQVVGDPETILIGIEDNKPEAIAALREAARGTKVEVVQFHTKYPSGGEKQLIQILTGQEVPSGQIPAQIGVLVQNVGTARAAFRAVRYGEPLIERVTTVVGEALGRQRNVRVRIGTPMDFVLEQHAFAEREAARLIVGGPMMGFALDHPGVPVVKTTNCILAPSHQEMPEPPPALPCIRCGHCSEVCPARLLPQQLFWYAQSEDYDRLQNHNLFDCIECGACSYVCPSAIPLVQYYRAAKGAIRQAAQDKQKSDRARQRFEHRKERLNRAELEKEAKRAARKQAAETAKQAAAAANPEPTNGSPASGIPVDIVPAAAIRANSAVQGNSAIQASSVIQSNSAVQANKAGAARAENNAPADSDDPVAAALARAEVGADPAKHRAALERNLASAEASVARLQQQLAGESDHTRRDKLTAGLKQAEIKLLDVQDKLKAMDLGGPGLAAASSGAQRAMAKLSQSSDSTSADAVATLEQKLATARARLAEAERDASPTVAALQTGVAKLESKLAEARAADAGDSGASRSAEALDAAAAAIARAQARVVEDSGLSHAQKQARQVAQLESRLAKARERLAAAQADASDTVPALAAAVQALEDKLSSARKTLAEIN